MMKKYIRKLIEWLKGYARAEQDELVSYLIRNTASLALKKEEYVEFAPIKGTCGVIRLSGNSLPCFVYTVFEKKIMEFIEVRVEVSKPDRIHFSSQIKSTDQTQHGKEVETKEKYKEPFLVLANHLFQYFPFPMDGGVKKTKPELKEVAQ